jgi:NAD(P)-dependent dehydrogenase (short-subunit alcohol dehydrogenase family)
VQFQDKRIVITGSSRGIGLACAKEFLRLGARVAINGSNDTSTRAGLDVLGAGDRTVAAPGDVSTRSGCHALVSNAAEQLGGIDVLVNSAGVGTVGPIEDCTEAMWDTTLDVNLKGTFFCIQAALTQLRKSHGNIVNVASDAGLIGESGLTVYCASKGGVVNLTRALALELAPEIRVNCICPGYIDTDMVRRDMIEVAGDPAAAEQELLNYAPLKRIAAPVEIARAIAFMASDDAPFMTGAAMQVDGGTTAGHTTG